MDLKHGTWPSERHAVVCYCSATDRCVDGTSREQPAGRLPGQSSALWRVAASMPHTHLTPASEPTGCGPLPRRRGQAVLDDEALILVVDAVMGRDEQDHLLAQLEGDHHLQV